MAVGHLLWSYVDYDLRREQYSMTSTMFMSLRELLFDFNKQIAELRQEKESLQNKFDSLYRLHQMGRKKVAATMDEMNVYKEQVDILSNLVIHNEERIDELNSCSLKMELRSMRNNILVSGLDETPNENCSIVIQQLSRKDLELPDYP